MPHDWRSGWKPGTVRSVKIEADPRDGEHTLAFPLSHEREHFMITADEDTMRGICRACGDVEIVAVNRGKRGRVYRCREGVKARRRAAKKRQEANRLARGGTDGA